MRSAACLAATLLAAGLSVGPLATRGLVGGETKSATRLGTDGTRFTVNGRPAFLFGVSYYGALGAKDETVRQDLTELQKHGFNWIRVWATWAAFGEDVSAVDGEGKPREPFLKGLERLVAACDEQGVVVDVTLSRGNGSTGPARLQRLEAHRRAVETLLTALKAHGNWYLDLANERNIKEQPELAREYEALFGKEFLAELQRQDRARVAREVEALFEQAGKEYGDVKIPYEGTVAQKVKAELFEFRNLLVGKEAPDIEGVDQDGQRFRLSDYNGRVMLLDFWNQF